SLGEGTASRALCPFQARMNRGCDTSTRDTDTLISGWHNKCLRLPYPPSIKPETDSGCLLISSPAPVHHPSGFDERAHRGRTDIWRTIRNSLIPAQHSHSLIPAKVFTSSDQSRGVIADVPLFPARPA